MAHTAVVTGASGFVASELCKQLLEKGYNVRATVRSTADADKVSHLVALGAALPGRLTLHPADLLTPGSFDAVMEGADFVFHTASPFQIAVADPQRDLIEPAVAGTRNVVGAAARHKDRIKRVVITSSVAAVKGAKDPTPPASASGLYSEVDWNTTSSVDNGEGYWASKAQAERAALELARGAGLDLVAVLPNFVLGPMLSKRVDGLSVGFIKGWLEGKAGGGALVVCDVRDVARAHILAAETPGASGRYIVSSRRSIDPAFVSRTLQARFPAFAIPEGDALGCKDEVDNAKAQRELGLHLTPVATTLVDMAVAALQLGIVTPAMGA